MIRGMIAALLVGVVILGTGLTGLAVGQAVTGADRLADGIVVAVCLAVTLSALGGAWRLFRRQRPGSRPALGWEPGPGAGWLPPDAWAELPDVLPRLPRLGPRPPAPAVAVPPDALLRRLWRVRAELAYDQAGGMYSRSLLGWTAALTVSSGLALLLGAFLVTGHPTVGQAAAFGSVLMWLLVATGVTAGRASRNPRRHVALRRLQRELQAAYAATPGNIPAGPTVRLGNPAPHYDPDLPADTEGIGHRAGESGRRP